MKVLVWGSTVQKTLLNINTAIRDGNFKYLCVNISELHIDVFS